jgi:hypothetical protein
MKFVCPLLLMSVLIIKFDTHAACFVRYTRGVLHTRAHKAAVAHMRGRCRVSSIVDACFGVFRQSREQSRERNILSLYICISELGTELGNILSLSLSLSISELGTAVRGSTGRSGDGSAQVGQLQGRKIDHTSSRRV